MSKRPMDYFAKTLEKGMRILNLFDVGHSVWNLTEIAEKIGMNLTSTYRLANTFIELGYLTKDPKTKSLSLGPMSVAMGHRILRGFDLNRLIIPLIDKVHYEYGISIDVSLYRSGSLVQIYKIETENTLTYTQEVVSDFLYCTAIGKSILANLPKNEFLEIFNRQSFERRTEHTIVDKDKFHVELDAVREKGYAINNEEYIRGLIAIASPILNESTRRPIGAISFTSTTLEQSLEDFEKRHFAALCDLAKKVSEIIPKG